jgi:hypothetical protein
MIDQDIDDIKAKLGQRIAELEVALEERDAMTATAVKLARQDARRATLLETAEFLMTLAQSHRPRNIAEAASEIKGRAAEQQLSLPNAN